MRTTLELEGDFVDVICDKLAVVPLLIAVAAIPLVAITSFLFFAKISRLKA